MEDKIRIIPLGGQDETAKNMMAVEINDDIIVLDCGSKYPDKTKHGIDYVIPRFDYLLQHKANVKAYIICKGHDTVFGGLPYIYKKVPAPIYCSDMSKLFIEYFCYKNKIKNDLDFHIVETSDDFKVAGHRIRTFPTCTNVCRSFGVAISTSRGNIVYVDDFVIDNNSDQGYLTSSKMLSQVTEEDTLLLMSDSAFADRQGFSNPNYKISRLLERTFKDAPGRVFVVLNDLDIYNIEQTMKLGIKYGRRIIPFDETSRQKFISITNVYKLTLPKDTFASLDEVGRLRPQSVLVIIPGFGSTICNNIALLANGQNEDKRIKVNPTDTFVFGIQKTNTNETLLTNAIDELYKTNCNIVYFDKKELIKMHPSEEDLKTMIALFSPKNYLPINGSFRQLLANARLAVDMGIGLNHMNVFVLDNGMILNLVNGQGKINGEKVIAGDLLVDGKNVGSDKSSLTSERDIMGEDGVVILGICVSHRKKCIIAGPDVQTRGLVYVKDADTLLKELSQNFVNIVLDALEENRSFEEIKPLINDSTFKLVRRNILKTPLIVPIIIDADK